MPNLADVWQTVAQRMGVGLDLPQLPMTLRRTGGRGTPRREDADLHSQVQSALQEWQAARAYFDEVSGVTAPELVDHAIYNLEAAQRKYVYLLRQVQRARGAEPPPEEE